MYDTFFLFLQDLEKDYNPKDLAKFLLGQNPELLQQNVSIQPAIDRWDLDLFILITLFIHLNTLNIKLMSVSLFSSAWIMKQKSLLSLMRKNSHFHRRNFAKE